MTMNRSLSLALTLCLLTFFGSMLMGRTQIQPRLEGVVDARIARIVEISGH